jgi:hypothetical protein
MIRVTMLTALFASTVLSTSTFAQTPVRLRPGARISVFAPAVMNQPIAGSLEGIDATGLHVTRTDGSSITVPHNDIAQLYVSTGMRSHTLTGTGIGALSGFALGAAMVVVGVASDSDTDIDSLDRAVYTAVMIITTAGGAVAGTIIGALTQTENWEEVAPSRLRWGIAPTFNGGGGMRFVMALKI